MIRKSPPQLFGMIISRKGAKAQRNKNLRDFLRKHTFLGGIAIASSTAKFSLITKMYNRYNAKYVVFLYLFS